MVKQNRKKLSKKSRKTGKRNGRRTKMQYGGVAPLCNLGEATSGSSMLVRNTDANVHNTNPQASLDLDNKFNQYGSPVPLGSWVVQGGSNCGKSQNGGANCGKSQNGGANCGDEGVGTSNPKSETFKQYMENLNAKYNLPQMGGSDYPNNEQPYTQSNSSGSNSENMEPEAPEAGMKEMRDPGASMDSNLGSSGENSMSGGGFTTDPSEFIAGMPVYKAYDDCCPPAIIDGSLKFSSPDQPLCGLGAVKTGGSRKKRQHKGKSKRKQKGKSKRTQRGGDWTTSGRSKPAEYGKAFTGSPGVFEYPEDMSKRNFGCNQPSWGPECI